MIPPDLVDAVRALMARPRVLVGLDFDGVLAPIVEHRDQARPLPGSMAAVRRLATLPGVEVALVTGRAMASLRAVSGVGGEEPISVVGSHGAETAVRSGLGGLSPAQSMTPAAQELLDRIIASLGEIAAAGGLASGLDVEVKPAGAVLHTRRAAADVAKWATDQVLAGPASWDGVHVTRGKSVVEFAVTMTSKGVALQQLRAVTAADAVLYAGDDVTDETAFAALQPGDVGVKVGPGETHAAYRLDGPRDVRELLQLLVAERSQR
jgi:trehalose 6-phosphate phosphatase